MTVAPDKRIERYKKRIAELEAALENAMLCEHAKELRCFNCRTESQRLLSESSNEARRARAAKGESA
jgi:hypothetical protein